MPDNLDARSGPLINIKNVDGKWQEAASDEDHDTWHAPNYLGPSIQYSSMCTNITQPIAMV